MTGGQSIAQTVDRSYSTSGNIERVSDAVLSRTVGTSTTNVTKVACSNFGENDPFGAQGDLKTSITCDWNDNEWVETGDVLSLLLVVVEFQFFLVVERRLRLADFVAMSLDLLGGN